jgi:vacuolar-type H+-ATPase subunit F/Vma7
VHTLKIIQLSEDKNLAILSKRGIAMKRECPIVDSKFVYTKDELAYQEVLNEISNASEIVIVTYNISEKQSYLLDCIKNANDTATIKIITNIPSRWETYWGNNPRVQARKKISVYLTKLKPEDIGNKVSIYFNFANHGKIIMTNNIAYIGSANYSEESKSNIEFGFITRDKAFLRFLLEELVPEIENISTQYYLYNHAPLLIEISMGASALYKLRNDLFGQIYILADHRGEDIFYYNRDYDLLSKDTLDSINYLLSDLVQIESDVYDAISEITNDDEQSTSNINERYEFLIEYKTSVENFTLKDTIYDLARFDHNDRTSDILEHEYGMVADEEHLDYYAQKAFDKASDELNYLTQKAEDDLKELINILDACLEDINKCIALFKTFDLKKLNPVIDNT